MNRYQKWRKRLKKDGQDQRKETGLCNVSIGSDLRTDQFKKQRTDGTLKWMTQDSSRSLLSSGDSSFASSNDDYRQQTNLDMRDHYTNNNRNLPNYSKKCVWLIVFLLIGFFLFILCIFVLKPIIEHIQKKERIKNNIKTTKSVIAYDSTQLKSSYHTIPSSNFNKKVKSLSLPYIIFNNNAASSLTTIAMKTNKKNGYFYYVKPTISSFFVTENTTSTMPIVSTTANPIISASEDSTLIISTNALPKFNKRVNSSSILEKNNNLYISSTANQRINLATRPNLIHYNKENFPKASTKSNIYFKTNKFTLSKQKRTESMTIPTSKKTTWTSNIPTTNSFINKLTDIIISTTKSTKFDTATSTIKNIDMLLSNRFGVVFEDDNKIQPIEIEVEPDIIELAYPEITPFLSQSKPLIYSSPTEPVWRRQPPNYKETADLTLPPPSLPLPFFVVSASVQTMNSEFGSVTNSPQHKQKTKKMSRLLLNKERKQAPIIVTALLDIGRGNWFHFTRHFDTYLNYFEKLFRLDNFMIIYCESKVLSFIREHVPNANPRRLQIVETKMADLPFYRYRDEMQAILDDEQRNWSPHWDPQMRVHPEALYADYDVLVNSKTYFLNNATYISKFETSSQFFVWLDAGYGHGSPNIIPKKLWSPHLPLNQITVFKLTTQLEKVERYTLPIIYRKKKSVISGGFLAGSLSVIRRFNTFFFKTFMELLDSRHVDDDQTILLMTIRTYRSTFNIVHGGWFDAFKLLP